MATGWLQNMAAMANTTVSPSTYTQASSFGSALHANKLPNDIYAGVDFDSLNWLERQWAAWYVFIGDPVLATGIMSFLLHEVFYFGRCVPWIIVDRIPAMKRYKIQEDKVATPEQQWKCTKYVLWTHFTIELPQIWGFHPLAEYFGMATHEVPLPKITTIAWQVLMFFLFEDMWHYWTHRAMHTPYLYKKVHKLHHHFSAPFGLAAEYAHPIEILVLGTGTIGGPLLWCLISGGNLHIFTMYIFVLLRLSQAIDAHSGYDMPWSLHHWIPFWAGADHHDWHHEKFTSCYSSSFRHWDHWFGTDLSYKLHKAEARKKAACPPGESADKITKSQ
ncbi:uncharacterized protein L969DRAFT_615736 [Mixia osmundae IAM 14324]|uniref:Fatty acid hydroxylase domain-containing protein n=1 Tax=Mixia osmundae (strain CBS 9802 / IAM 14324 / JCM 22182 / KY 12970) TaxID=764103 RepID=G7DYP7_MIXOS|nr:uncharacterized protein L969DRAFT_615736 [Mixia osmundae IAM 14324]KEI41607.1 hypothetical protein L969DRAFT_615736 [Mixia osmundae IAM 14324]GAA95707.1 hypothetical protein E5Q_02364 [Mixia osmundae IAM 14324]